MAGTLDSLNFEVILDDKKFNKAVENDLKIAKMLNTELSRVLDLRKSLNSETAKQTINAEKVRQAEQKTAQEKAKAVLYEQKVRTEVEKTKAAQEGYTSAIKSTNASLLNTTNIMRVLSQLTGVTFSIATVRKFLSSMIEITGQFELQKVALRTILQDAAGADRIFAQLYQFSSDSMYRFSELAKHAKQLAAFGIAQDDILDTTKMLGDVSAGLGVSIDRLILAYGHVKSSGFLRGIQLRSFSQNGVPILDELAKMMSEVEGRAVSLGEVFDRMTKRQIDFGMVEEAFRRMTQEGGQFHNIQEQMARTLSGEINVLKGRWENLMYAMGEQTEGVVLTIVRAISESISSLDKFKDTLRSFAEAGSPVWALIGELRRTIAEARALKGKGSETSLDGGGGFAGGGQGGGTRGLEKQEEVYLKISNIVNQIKTEEKEIARLRSKAAKEGLTTGLDGGVSEVQLLQNAVEARDELLKQYKDITGEDYYKRQGSGAKSSDDERIRDLKDEVAYLKKLADYYEKLEKYLGANGANEKMVELFGKRDYSRSAIESTVSEITGLLRGLGKEGKEAADTIEENWGIDKASRTLKQLENEKKAADDAQKSLKKYLDTVQEWSDKNNVGAFSGALKNYYKALSDADKQAKNALTSLLYGTSDNNTRLMGFAQINSEWAKSKANALTNLQKDLNKYAESYLKEELERQGFDLTNWGDKTLEQINAIKNAINDVTISDELRETILGMGEDGDKLLALLDDTLEKIKQAKIDKTVDPERWKKIAKQAKYIAERFLSVSESLKEFADASGNQALSDAASRIGAIAQTLKSAWEGYKSFGGWWGAIIGGGSDLIEQVLGGLTATEREAAELRDIVRDIRQETEKEAFKSALMDGVDGIFGENAVRRLQNAASSLQSILAAVEKLEYAKPNRGLLGYKEEDMMDWERWKAYSEGNVGAMPFVTNHSWLTGDTTRTLSDLADEFDLAMYNEYNFLNPKLLQAILDNYGALNDGAVEWLTNSIRYAEEYEEALQQVDESTKAVFGDIASQAADHIVDSWIEAGSAALDYADILDDVARSYSKMLIQSTIMETFLDPITEDLKRAFMSGNYESAMSMIAEAMDGVANSAPMFEEILSAFDPYFNRDGSSGASSLGSGIKSITEDTANLLASYINAIRADVSIMRGLQEKGWGYIEAFGSSLPTLNDYLAQIAATNFDIAQSNQSILSELQSVIGSPGTSGMVVRVEYA